jgi:organic radical activating enzyme
MQQHTIQGADALLASYRNGGYKVDIFADGTKVRTELDASQPPVLPEQMDLKITDWCDAGCAWCHEKSTTKGTHGNVTRTLELLKDLSAGTEIAIGGGDPLSHPEFERFVRGLRAQGLVPSVTVNGRHFDRHRALLEKLTAEGQLFGVGISYHDRIPDWDYEHMVLHLIAGVNPPSVLDDAPRRMKVLLLGYKRFGRGKKLFEVRTKEVQDTLAAWYRELFEVAHNHHLSFDNLAIDQLRPQRVFKDLGAYQQQYMGPEGQFSMYVDAVTETFALSSYSEERFGWSNMRNMFAHVRQGQGYDVAKVAA